MTFVKRLGIALLIIVVVVVGVAYLLPSKIHVERSTTIDASPEIVFNEVNDLKLWSAWSPWHLTEPDAKYEYSGPEAGVGATATWKGETIGEGTQKIETSVPYSEITTSLDFGSQGKATSEWKFDPDGEGTKVTWGFDTDMGMNPISRYFGLMMDGVIGADYEQGLGNLKQVCEEKAQAPPTDDNSPADELPTDDNSGTAPS